MKQDKRKIKVPILWEKTYYQNDLIGGSEKEKWLGVMFLFRFLILEGKNKNRFLIEPAVEDFRGNNKQEMVDALEKKIEGLEEWILSGKHWKNADFFPKEVNKKLVEFNLEKYVKKIS